MDPLKLDWQRLFHSFTFLKSSANLSSHPTLGTIKKNTHIIRRTKWMSKFFGSTEKKLPWFYWSCTAKWLRSLNCNFGKVFVNKKDNRRNQHQTQFKCYVKLKRHSCLFFMCVISDDDGKRKKKWLVSKSHRIRPENQKCYSSRFLITSIH